MKILVQSAIFIFSASLMACTGQNLFPSNIISDVDSQSDFGVLRAQPDAFKGRAVQLAGRIIDVQEVEGGSLVLARELPIDSAPVYGPKETPAPTGRFAFLYPGKIDPMGKRGGNKFVVVGVMNGTKAVDFEGASVAKPYLEARCVHIWKTGNYYEISDFPHVTDGYYPLPEETYCAK
jgi:starvation-inducible outer membrane lipoprotein